MALFTFLILITLHASLAEDCLINNIPERMAFEKQLRKDLKCNYEVFDPPPYNGSTFPIKVKIVMKKFSFNSDEDTFSAQTRMFISWNDPRLRWDPQKYYGIGVTELSVMKIWAPTLTLVNSVDNLDFDRFYFSTCTIVSDGDVRCVRKVTHDAFCNVDLSYWPYDQQQCSLIFEASDSRWLKIQINASSRVFSMWGAEYGAEWVITDYKQETNHSSHDKQLKVTFTVEREAEGLAAIVVYPAVILTFLSVTSLLMDVRRPIRLGLASFCLLCHHYFLCELAENLPKKTLKPPNLLLYYRASLVMSLVLLLLSCVLGKICRLKSAPQNYIITLNNFVFESFGKYFVFPQWDLECDSDGKPFSQDWTKFANIINTVFVVVIIVTYVCLYAILMPQPIPITY